MIEPTDHRVNQWLFFGGAAVLLLFVAGGGLLYLRGDRGRPRPDPDLVQRLAPLDSKIKAEERTVGQPEIAVDASDLHQAYDRDEATADETYRNRRLLVSAVVKAVQQEPGYNVVLVLQGPALFAVERATLIETETAKAAGLPRGKEVLLRCTGNGRILQTPSLTACEIE